jgi:glycosyltransferase involved in cell wall biosynthesis
MGDAWDTPLPLSIRRRTFRRNAVDGKQEHRKKILLISPYFPYPAHDGGKVRIFNLIKQLAAVNDVYLLSYIESEQARAHIPPLERFCKKIYAVVRDQATRIIEQQLPRSMSFFYTPGMISLLERVMEEVRPDLVQIDFLIMTQYVRHIKGVPVIYTEHDMSNIDFEQSFHDRDLPERERFVEWGRLVTFEKRILSEFSGVIVLTERDQDILSRFLPGRDSVLVPTGVDVDYFRPVPCGEEPAEKNILFVGHYGHYPNYDAVSHFCADVFPSVVREVPDAKLWIVGSGVPERMKAFAAPNTVVTGAVEDVREYMRRATVFVAPVRLGGGIKGKILEAMAAGIPIVATLEASAGICCVPGQHVLVARDAADFTRKTVELLNDGERRNALAAQARRLVEQHYDWKMIGATLNAYYDGVLSRRGI